MRAWSSREGVGSPLGWLWATATALLRSRTAERKTSAGSTTVQRLLPRLMARQEWGCSCALRHTTQSFDGLMLEMRTQERCKGGWVVEPSRGWVHLCSLGQLECGVHLDGSCRTNTGHVGECLHRGRASLRKGPEDGQQLGGDVGGADAFGACAQHQCEPRWG